MFSDLQVVLLEAWRVTVLLQSVLNHRVEKLVLEDFPLVTIIYKYNATLGTG